jgi:hypothetical protein
MLSAAVSPFCRIAPEGAFCKPEEDPFLLLESTLRSVEEILLRRRGLPLRRTWIEQLRKAHGIRPKGPPTMADPTLLTTFHRAQFAAPRYGQAGFSSAVEVPVPAVAQPGRKPADAARLQPGG